MGWQGNGTIQRTDGTRTGADVWQQASAAIEDIISDDHDTHDQDLADAIEKCLNLDGENSPTTDISWGSNKITSLADGTAAGDAVAYDQDGLRLESTDAGASAGPTFTLYRNSASPAADDVLGEIKFDGEDDGGNAEAYAKIEAQIAVTTNGSEEGRLAFYLQDGSGSIAEQIRLVPGDVLFGKTSADSGATAGVEMDTGGAPCFFTSDDVVTLNLNRLAGDGQLVQFRQAGTEEGNISVSGTTVSYNTFTGGHWAQWADGEEPPQDPLRGTLLSTTDQSYERCLEVDRKTGHKKRVPGKGRCRRGRPDVIDAPKPQLCAVKITDQQDDRRVYGVFGGVDRESGDINVFGLGTAEVRIKGPASGGDLLRASATPGVAEAQPDDLVRSSTVGKVSMGDDRTDERLVACVLCCG